MKILIKLISDGVLSILYIDYSLYLNEVRKNLAANLQQLPSNHSYCYAFSGNRQILIAIFPLIFVPS
ncbi:MAG: hypothetical protein IIA99_01780 [Proteobacteria bacterium]|nr:hypothetical protein [Pseudomonadota bacterium]MCH8262937.1 hypothetical protein [Pseudomonadota bacterium]